MPRVERVMVAVLVVSLAVAADCGGPGNGTPAPTSPSATPSPRPEARSYPAVILPDGQAIEVEIAADDDTRAQGLMFRESVARGKGMLFLFSESGIYPFWMKNTVIPLDIIWIDLGGAVVHIEANVPPCETDPCPSYSPGVDALRVLELGAGEAARLNLETGDHLELRNLEGVVVR